MVEVVNLAPGEDMPDVGDDKPWLIVEATSEGLFTEAALRGSPTVVGRLPVSHRR